MIRVYFLLVVVGVIWWLTGFFTKNTGQRKLYIKQSFVVFVVLIIVLLALTGRLHWLLAVIAGAVAFVMRFLPVLLRYIPQIQKLMQFFYHSRNAANQSKSSPQKSTNLTKAQACDILGVSLTATKQEIIDAHRKLIFKNHPDRGGSDYLAAQINQAKETLLQR